MWKWLLFNAVLFIAFVPGVLVTLPPKGDKMTVLVVQNIYGKRHSPFESRTEPAGHPRESTRVSGISKNSRRFT